MATPILLNAVCLTFFFFLPHKSQVPVTETFCASQKLKHLLSDFWQKSLMTYDLVPYFVQMNTKQVPRQLKRECLLLGNHFSSCPVEIQGLKASGHLPTSFHLPLK